MDRHKSMSYCKKMGKDANIDTYNANPYIQSNTLFLSPSRGISK